MEAIDELLKGIHVAGGMFAVRDGPREYLSLPIRYIWSRRYVVSGDASSVSHLS